MTFVAITTRRDPAPLSMVERHEVRRFQGDRMGKLFLRKAKLQLGSGIGDLNRTNVDVDRRRKKRLPKSLRDMTRWVLYVVGLLESGIVRSRLLEIWVHGADFFESGDRAVWPLEV
ncbi:hypothetical protein NPIL_18441 [Nephila pilipes]|uniref:Uncharacterized protein n=1 Tax=Nephila pilipes TaxID=299642 RepID=A0A8X6NYW3_NEPPI|nr:hypothetical protein NPIL_18441 [Nephila pilipes]